MQIALLYESTKTSLVAFLGITDAECHIHAGMLVFLLTAFILRKPLRSPWPLLAVILVESINEYFDYVSHGSWRWPDTSRDILFTLGWPLIIFLMLRLRALKA